DLMRPRSTSKRNFRTICWVKPSCGTFLSPTTLRESLSLFFAVGDLGINIALAGQGLAVQALFVRLPKTLVTIYSSALQLIVMRDSVQRCLQRRHRWCGNRCCRKAVTLNYKSQ